MLGFAVAPWGFADSEFPAQIQTNVLLTFIYISYLIQCFSNQYDKFLSAYFDISKCKKENIGHILLSIFGKM